MRIVGGIGNEKLIKYYQGLFNSHQRYYAIGLSERPGWQTSVNEHRLILEKITSRDAVGAFTCARQHASNTIDRVLAALEKRGKEADGSPAANGRPADEETGLHAQSSINQKTKRRMGMKFRFDKNVTALLEGSIDIHIHSAPDVYPRLLNDVELALSAKENGMRAILVKNHYFETAGRARLASDVADFPVFGGIALNLTNGGLNKHAVKMALKMGAKEVWMPTVHADYFVRNKNHVANLATEIGADVQGLVLVNKDGTLKDELYEIFDIIKEADAIFATGHVTKEEAKLAVREAAKRGVKKIIVTHPAATFVHYSVDDMKEILDLGATFLEHTWNDVTRQVSHPLQISVLFDFIKAVGAAHSIMSTDAGQWLNPPAAQQMGIYIKEALMSGISAKDVRTMVADNPAKILGI